MPEPGTDPNTKYSVFFSHKVNDKEVTKSLIKLLDGHTENVSFPISEQIEKGTRWRKAIADLLNRANFLVLVFTDPNEDWGWCLYESGFFDALSPGRKHVAASGVCTTPQPIHHRLLPTYRASQLKRGRRAVA